MDRHGCIIRTKYDSNTINIRKDFAEIHLYNNHGEHIETTIIDIEDVELCKKYKWSLTKDGYVLTYKDGEYIYLHRLLLNAKVG